MYFAENIFYYGNFSITKYEKIPKKVIDFYHLTLVLKGKITYIADGVKYELHENDTLLLKPGTLRERLKGENSAKFVIINFHAIKGNEPPIDTYLRSAVNRNIRRLLSVYPYTLYSNSIQPQNHEMKKTEYLLRNILNCILAELLDSQKYNTKNNHVINAKKYINDNITSTLSLAEVSKAIHLSKEYTAKIFKKETGKTVTEYINEQKMIIAKDMLNTNEMSIKDIAYNLGYENYSYFSRMFKRYFKTTPGKIKK